LCTLCTISIIIIIIIVIVVVVLKRILIFLVVTMSVSTRSQGCTISSSVGQHSVKAGKQVTHTSNGPLSGTTRVSRYQKGKPIWMLLKQETVSSSGISWAICKSAPRCRQITTPTPHHSVFLQAGCPSYHPINSQCTEGN